MDGWVGYVAFVRESCGSWVSRRLVYLPVSESRWNFPVAEVISGLYGDFVIYIFLGRGP
ncbi:hypothetical protein BDV26DRAFT_251151 [Aspergillus bertholletiae]|uniref:Uncharacterized protein n=1 Tax=Aspergillus bertholletiae TaxID=1226010 RepID=A0A5N7BP26_9EURO|nr:hypothetical protein BDV26DRAFT_251151 [Aspergillus bertholletiae]